MNRSISNWIHRIGEGAVKALEEEYEFRDLRTKEARARFVAVQHGYLVSRISCTRDTHFAPISPADHR